MGGGGVNTFYVIKGQCTDFTCKSNFFFMNLENYKPCFDSLGEKVSKVLFKYNDAFLMDSFLSGIAGSPAHNRLGQ